MGRKAVFHRVGEYLLERGLPLRAVLILDNAPTHPPGLQEKLLEEFSFITVKILPPNTTPLIKPMDQQVIANFKKLYTKAVFQRCCVNLIDKAWDKVSQRTMNSGWRNLWPDCIPGWDFEGFEAEPDAPVVEELVSLGKSLGLEVDDADVEELVKEHKDKLKTEELQDLQQEQQKQELSSGEEEPGEDVPSSLIKKI